MWKFLGLMLAIVIFIWAFLSVMDPTKSETIRCWYAYVTPESNTVACNNGFWYTTKSDGTVVTGNGMVDPNARSTGSTIVIDGATGGITTKAPPVTAPQGQIELDAPHQAPAWGQQPLQTR